MSNSANKITENFSVSEKYRLFLTENDKFSMRNYYLGKF